MKRLKNVMDCDDLKKYCPIEGPAEYTSPTGYHSCEGCKCEEAYENYLDSEDDEDEE